jgi:hypothetical protein
MVGEIQSWWLMLEVSFEHRVATVASSGVGHKPTVVSQLPEATVNPFGLNATLNTRPVWPCMGWPNGPACAGSVTFHNRTVSSVLPEARVCPSGPNAEYYARVHASNDARRQYVGSVRGGELVRRLAPLHWDGSPNQSSETVRSDPAGPRSFRVGVPLGVRLTA